MTAARVPALAADAPAPGSAPGPSAQSALCAGRNLRRLSRSPLTLVQSVFFPTLLLVVLLIAFGRVIGGSVSAYSARLVPQLVVAAGAFGAAGTGVAVFTDRHDGMIERLRSLPIARRSYLVGTVAADAVRVAAAAVIVVVVGHVPGFRFEQGAVAALGFFAVAVAFGAVWAWVAVTLGLRAGSSQAVGSTMNGPILMLFFLSTGFVPVEGFPAALQPVVRANPLSCAVDALIGLSSGGPVLVPVLQTLAWTVGLVAVFATIAVRTYRRG
jgi:ABC transporter DrrB family efflux protein